MIGKLLGLNKRTLGNPSDSPLKLTSLGIDKQNDL